MGVLKPFNLTIYVAIVIGPRQCLKQLSSYPDLQGCFELYYPVTNPYVPALVSHYQLVFFLIFILFWELNAHNHSDLWSLCRSRHPKSPTVSHVTENQVKRSWTRRGFLETLCESKLGKQTEKGEDIRTWASADHVPSGCYQPAGASYFSFCVSRK